MNNFFLAWIFLFTMFAVGVFIGHQRKEGCDCPEVKVELEIVKAIYEAEREYFNEEIKFLMYANDFGFCDPRHMAGYIESCEDQNELMHNHYEFLKDCEKELKECKKSSCTVEEVIAHPVFERCANATSAFMSEEMKLQTSLKYNKRKLSECQDQVLDQEMIERGIR